jgi:hypothetical protein
MQTRKYMAKESSQIAIPDEIISSKIYLIRDKKVMLDEDLSGLYNVTTGVLNQAVKRNLARFPDDFMFQLTNEEFDNLFFQIGTSSWGGRRKPPYAFTSRELLCNWEKPENKTTHSRTKSNALSCWNLQVPLNSICILRIHSSI